MKDDDKTAWDKTYDAEVAKSEQNVLTRKTGAGYKDFSDP